MSDGSTAAARADGARVVSAGTLELRVRDSDGGVVLEAIGELDLACRGLLEAELHRAETGPARSIVLDLAKLEFIDSSGIRILLNAARRSRADGRRLVIRSAHDHVSRTFERSGVMELLIPGS